MAENASPHPPSKRISFSACSPKSGEIPADTTQVPVHGISAIAVAKATCLQEKEHLLLIAEEEKQNMIVDQPPNLQPHLVQPCAVQLRTETSDKQHT